MAIFFKNGGRLTEVTPRPFKDEAELQRLIEQHTNLIPMDLDPRRKAIREFHTASGGIDHVVIDASGSVLILETKLAKNTTRREVIAQAVDYAAQLTKFGPQAFLDRARDKAGGDFTEDWFETEAEREEFIRSLETNLRLGQLSLLIVMDHAEVRLKDAVRFLNRATHFTCLIAEVTVSDIGGRDLVAVDLYGEESVEEKTSTGGAKKLDRRTFLEALAGAGMGDEAAAYLSALEQIEAEGGRPGSTPAGFYLAGEPPTSYHYLMWQVSSSKFHVWAPAEFYDAVKAHLREAPGPWRDRLDIRSLKPGGQHGKVVDIEAGGVTDPADYLALFRHYLAPPRSGE